MFHLGDLSRLGRIILLQAARSRSQKTLERDPLQWAPSELFIVYRLRFSKRQVDADSTAAAQPRGIHGGVRLRVIVQPRLHVDTSALVSVLAITLLHITTLFAFLHLRSTPQKMVDNISVQVIRQNSKISESRNAHFSRASQHARALTTSQSTFPTTLIPAHLPQNGSLTFLFN